MLASFRFDPDMVLHYDTNIISKINAHYYKTANLIPFQKLKAFTATKYLE